MALDPTIEAVVERLSKVSPPAYLDEDQAYKRGIMRMAIMEYIGTARSGRFDSTFASISEHDKVAANFARHDGVLNAAMHFFANPNQHDAFENVCDAFYCETPQDIRNLCLYHSEPLRLAVLMQTGDTVEFIAYPHGSAPSVQSSAFTEVMRYSKFYILVTYLRRRAAQCSGQTKHDC